MAVMLFTGRYVFRHFFNGWWAFRFSQLHKKVIGCFLASPRVRMPPKENLAF